MLQFNYETTVTYGEDGYSSLSVRGTIEIPMTRPNQRSRTLTSTVDNLRSVLDTRIFAGIDLSRFHVLRREYPISRDKRTMDFNIEIEEKPYMDLPPLQTIARGTYSVRPAKAGMGLCLWLCTLRATYTVRADAPRRNAWFAFLALLRWRMAQSQLGYIPKSGGGQNPGKGALKILAAGTISPLGAGVGGTLGTFWPSLFGGQNTKDARKAWLIDFSVDEGLYLDSKTTSFSATWRMVTTFSHILLASGLWRKLQEKDTQGNNIWATSMQLPIQGSPTGVMGSQSWLPNKTDPKLDIIVDFGGQSPLQ